MTLNNKAQLSWGGVVLSWFATYVQVNEIFEYAQLILSILATIFTLVISVLVVVEKIHAKIEKAKEDGKIDIHEATEIAQATLQGLEELSEQVSTLDKREEIKKERGNKNG